LSENVKTQIKKLYTFQINVKEICAVRLRVGARDNICDYTTVSMRGERVVY
jgi:hypothetical protein